MARLWQVYAAIFSALTVVCFALPAGTAADIVYGAIGLSCFIAICAGVRLHKPAARSPWYFMAAGQAAWFLGDSVYVWEIHDGEVTFPALSDIPYATAYPFVALGVWQLIRAQRRPRDVAGLVDSLIVAAGVGLLSWAFVAGPLLEDQTLSTLDSLLAVAYPAGDILVLALLVRLITGQGAWTPSFRLLVGAALMVLAADTGFAIDPTGYVQVAGLEILWLASYVFWGAAALHPDMVNLTAPGTRASTTFTTKRLIILGGVVLLPVLLALGREMLDLRVDQSALVAGSAVLSLLVMGRMACAIDEIRMTRRHRDDLQEVLFRRATEDDVTGLSNHPSFMQLLEFALERGARDGTCSAVVVIEIGGVAEIVRHRGHAQGDALLRSIAQRIAAAVGHDDRIARTGPDQFSVLIDRLDHEPDVAQLAQDVVASCRAPVHLDGSPVTPFAWAGVVVSRDDGTDPESLLHDATLASASARAAGDRSVEFFDSSLRDEAIHRQDIESGLREALSSDQLEVWYQPLMSVADRSLCGYEALVRWNRPGHGMLFPDSFIPVAEKSDLICELDRWVLHEAARQLTAWTRSDPERCATLVISVNVSGRNLASATILDDVSEALRLTGLDPSRLDLEITETVLVEVPRANAQMKALQDLGVRISVDDFGTGYTSIGQLGQLPADVIKVDRSIVTSSKKGARELLALIGQVAHSSGLRVVAEGIESSDDLRTVIELNYDVAQGYLIGKPQPACDAHRLGLSLTGAQPPSGFTL